MQGKWLLDVCLVDVMRHSVPDNVHQTHVQTTFHLCKTRSCQCSFRLLMMGGVLLETCWASYKHKIIKILIKCCTACRGSRGIALLFHDHGTRRGWGLSVTPQPLFTPMKDPVPLVQEAGWAPGSVWTGAENLATTGIRSPDRPVRSQSLYRRR
jgi:hypothetical protein